MVKTYNFIATYSDFRHELYVHDRNDNLLFVVQEEHLPINSHTKDIPFWYEWLVSNYDDILTDMGVL